MLSLKTAYIFSHTHWDREWYFTQRQLQFLLARTFDEVLDTLESRPEFAAFAADGQTIIFSDYCELRPENSERFLSLAREGRIEMGPWYTQPDLWIPSGESLIRNLLAGNLDCDELSVPHAKIGYVPDSFGHIEQMPQIMNGFGINNYLCMRGDTPEGLGPRVQFIWKGPDGISALTAHRTEPNGYNNAAGMPLHRLDALKNQVGRILDHASAHSSKPLALLSNGVDHIWVQRQLPEIIQELESLFPDWQFKHSTLGGYMEAFDKAPVCKDMTVHTGCLHSRRLSAGLLHGTWSSRIDLKLQNAKAEIALTNLAEPLSTLAMLYGGPDTRRETGLAWRLLMSNHAHDSLCGCSMDDVHSDNLRRYGQVLELAEMVAGEALEGLGAAAIRNDIPTLVRWAGLGGAKGCIEFIIDGSDDRCFHFADGDGNTYPVQIVSKRRLLRSDAAFEGGIWLDRKEVETEFTEIRGVVDLPYAPPCSVTKYHITEGPCPGTNTDKVSVSAGIIENGLLRVEAHKDGTIDMLHKETGIIYSGMLALSDEADLGGGYSFAPLERDMTHTSTEAVFDISMMEKGPLRAAMAIEGSWLLPKSMSPDYTERSGETGAVQIKTTVFLEAGSSLLKCSTTLVNGCKDHRVRLTVPLPYSTSIADVERSFVAAREDMGDYTAEPGQDTHPMRNWVSVQSPDNTGGFAFIGKGLHEYSLISNDRSNTSLSVTLLRAVPAINGSRTWATPQAQLQTTLSYDYALYFHSGDWRRSNVACIAHRFVNPAITQGFGVSRVPWDHLMHLNLGLKEVTESGVSTASSTHRSTWRTVFAQRDGWWAREEERLPQLDTPDRILPLEIDSPNVLVSAFKLAERAPEGGIDHSRDVIVRLYSLAGSRENVTVRFSQPLAGRLGEQGKTKVWTAGLDEASLGEALELDGNNTVTLDMRPFEIKTLRFRTE